MQFSRCLTSCEFYTLSVPAVVFAASLVLILMQLSLDNPHGLTIVGMSITALASLAGNLELLRRIRAKSDGDGDFSY